MRLLVLLLVLTGAVQACPFCAPAEADLFSELQEAQAVVLVSKVESQKFKIVEVWKGQATVGKVVLAGEARGKATSGSRLLLTTAGPPNLPYWSDAPRHLTPDDLSFVKKALPLARAGNAQKWDFGVAHLERGSAEVKVAAYSLLAGAPLSEVQKRARTVGQARLVSWVKSPNVPAERRALYLLMATPGLGPGDAGWLKSALFNPKLTLSSPMVGPYVVAYLQTAGAAGVAQVEKRFLGPSVAPAQTLEVTRALALVAHRSSSPALKSSIQAVFLREVVHPKRGPFAVAPLAVWRDYRAAATVEKMARDSRETWVKVAAIRYFRSFNSPEARAALDRMSRLDGNLVSRTNDGYKVSDLGIE